MKKYLFKRVSMMILGVATLFAALAVTPTVGNASTKLRSYSNIKDASYTVNQKATVYTNGKLSHKKGTMKSFGKVVTGYYAAHITKNGKKTVYYKFETANGKTGWAWHGYFKKFTPKEKFSVAKYNADLLNEINSLRKKNAQLPLKVDANLQSKIAVPEANKFAKNPSNFVSQKNFQAGILAKKLGLSLDQELWGAGSYLYNTNKEAATKNLQLWLKDDGFDVTWNNYEVVGISTVHSGSKNYTVLELN